MRCKAIVLCVFALSVLATGAQASPWGGVSGLYTPYGFAKKEGNAAPKLKIGGKVYTVQQRGPSFVYTNEAGTSFRHAPREGTHFRMPGGLTRTLVTDSGVEEVLVGTGHYGDRSFHIVRMTNGRETSDPIKKMYTNGNTQLVIKDGRLSERVTIRGKSYELRLDKKTQTPRFVNPDGTLSEGAPRVNGRYQLDEGQTKPLMTAQGLRHVLVTREKGYRGENTTTIELVTFEYGVLNTSSFEPTQTAFGPATVVERKGELVEEVEIDGRPHRLVYAPGGRLSYVDSKGVAYRDPYNEKIAATSKAEAQKSTVKNPYDANARRLTDGTIVHIEGNDYMNQETYGQLRDAMIDAMKLYNPRKHYFIGLGSDPHPIIAFLENLGGRGLAVNFPASGKYQEGLDPNILHPYVRKLIPPSVLAGEKRLVLLDQTNSGAAYEGTLAQITPVFKDYLKTIGSPAKVVPLAFSPSAQNRGTGHVSTANYPEVGRFLKPPYEHVTSEYDRHVLGSNTLEELQPRPQYKRFKQAIYRRMQRDEKLDKFLSDDLKL